jgi:hypothetical protein
VLAGAAALLAAGGIAYATIPDSNGVIHACYQKSVGNLRVIDPSSDSCRPSEVPRGAARLGPNRPAGSGPAHSYATSAGRTHVALEASGFTQVTSPHRSGRELRRHVVQATELASGQRRSPFSQGSDIREPDLDQGSRTDSADDPLLDSSQVARSTIVDAISRLKRRSVRKARGGRGAAGRRPRRTARGSGAGRGRARGKRGGRSRGGRTRRSSRPPRRGRPRR